MTTRNRTLRGRWIVVTGRVVSRHRSKQQARGAARLNSSLGARLRNHRRDLEWRDGDMLTRRRQS